jgi:hypothetical protein
MSITELPPSVLYSPKDFGPGTLSRLDSGFKVQEANALALKRQSGLQERTLQLKKEDGTFLSSIFFKPTPELDIIGVYPHDSALKTYAARNGVYIELGVIGKFGGAFGRYGLETGSMIGQEIDVESFPHATLPFEMDTKDVAFIVNLCSQLRKPATPEPTDIQRITSFLSENINTQEPFHQSTFSF